jgi:sialidase-1
MIRFSVLGLLLLLTRSAVAAAEPLLEKADLFEAGKEGYVLYRIPGIVVTAKGTVLAYCEARKSDKGDWGTIDILRTARSSASTSAAGPAPPATATAPFAWCGSIWSG